MIHFKGTDYNPRDYVIWSNIDWQKYVSEEKKREYRRGWSNAKKKLIKEFLADLNKIHNPWGLIDYDDTWDKLKEKWEKKLAESGSGGEF